MISNVKHIFVCVFYFLGQNIMSFLLMMIGFDFLTNDENLMLINWEGKYTLNWLVAKNN